MSTAQMPPIQITAPDFDRLERLLDSVKEQDSPGIQALRVEVERADIVEGEPEGEFIAMGSTAKFIEESSNRTYELTLVYPHEADGSPEKVSILAPIGSALLGLSVGQTIAWPIQGGRTLQLRVLQIHNEKSTP